MTPSGSVVLCLLLSVLCSFSTLSAALPLPSSPPSSDPPSAYCDQCLHSAEYLSQFLYSPLGRSSVQAMTFSDCLYSAYNRSCHSADQCFDLCHSFTAEYTDVILLSLNRTVGPSVICAELQLCPPPPPPPPPSTAIPVPSDLSDSSGQPRWPMWANTTGTGVIAHLSDMHVDRLYAVGAAIDCGFPLCCRAEWGEGRSASDSAGLYGEYNCDTPERTAESLMSHLNASTPRPDFILYTGDDPAHDIWEQSREVVLSAINYTTTILHKYFPDVPILQTLGNHEGFPVDNFAGPPIDDWLYSSLPRFWGMDLSNDAKRTVAYGGYYQTLIRPGLRVISINSNIYATGNLQLDPTNLVDVSYQLNWLADVLRQLRDRDERAIVIAHQSPSSWYPVFSARFNALLSAHSQHIVNLFWGHTHHSEVQLYTDEGGERAHTVGYIGGSFTPYTDTNPGYQVYEYQRASVNTSRYLVQDYQVVWIDLPEANRQYQADWAVHMTAKADCGLPDLSPASWFKLAESIKGGGSAEAFDALATAFRRGFSNSTGVNPRDWACQMESDSRDKYRMCYERMGMEAPVRQVRGACDGMGPEETARVRAKMAEVREARARTGGKEPASKMVGKRRATRGEL